MSSKRVSQIFKILFETGNINIFVLRGVFFSRYVPLKSSFPDEKKYQRWNLRQTLAEGSIKGKVLRENSITGRSCRSIKIFIMQNYTDNADGNVPLTVENAWYF